MIDAKDDVEEQWKNWQEDNPAETLVDIDEDYLKEKILRELTYVSQMDVKEYT